MVNSQDDEIVFTDKNNTTVYTTDGNHFDLHLEANEIKWYEI